MGAPPALASVVSCHAFPADGVTGMPGKAEHMPAHGYTHPDHGHDEGGDGGLEGVPNRHDGEINGTPTRNQVEACVPDLIIEERTVKSPAERPRSDFVQAKKAEQ